MSTRRSVQDLRSCEAAAARLVERQRIAVADMSPASPDHRTATETLGLLEEGHFVLAELSRVTEDPRATPSAARRLSRHSLAFAAIFVIATIAGFFVVEIVDPAPMELRAHGSISFVP